MVASQPDITLKQLQYPCLEIFKSMLELTDDKNFIIFVEENLP